MKKIVTIVGARPQFIKLAPVSKELRKKCVEVIVNTGQHYDYKMAGIFFDELNIPRPDYDLGVGSGSHGVQTGEMLIKIEQVLEQEKPDAVIVYGDTNSTLAGALCASKLHIPLIHIESGLRSFNKKMPEEINRIMTDHVSHVLFAPTDTAVAHLQNEGITKNVYNVGDVMFDATLNNLEIAESKYGILDLGLQPKSYYLATIHRAENTDDIRRLTAIFESFLKLDEIVYLPIHPRTVKKLKDEGLYSRIEESGNLIVAEPVSYLQMLLLEKYAKGIITDSGGVQKEAYFAKIPCYTLRTETEWVETVNTGWNQLIDPLQDRLDEILKTDKQRSYRDDLYGDGQASVKIVNVIEQTLF